MSKSQAELEKQLEEIIRPLVQEALEDLVFQLVDGIACEIIDRGLEDEWE